MLLDLLTTLLQADARPTTHHYTLIAFFEAIDLAEDQWINAKLLTQILHRRFNGEECLRAKGGAIGTGANLVGLDQIATHSNVGAAVDTHKMHAAQTSQRIGVGSQIKNQVGLDSRERTVFLRPNLDSHK